MYILNHFIPQKPFVVGYKKSVLNLCKRDLFTQIHFSQILLQICHTIKLYMYMYVSHLWLTFILGIGLLLEESARAKVNQLDLITLKIDEDILVLHISVNHAH